MNVLIIKNIASEGPGTIVDYLNDKGISYSILDLYDCKVEIPNIRDFSHLVIMGGPMAVYEIDQHAFLSYEVAIIRAFVKTNRPVLGICLGAQMIAHALGASVYAGGTQEIGWSRVTITPEGMNNPVISTLSVNGEPFAEVFQWHGDTFDLPRGAVQIATSEIYQNQAFLYRDNVYALQFHIEVKPEMIIEWFKDREEVDFEALLKETEEIFPEYRKRAMRFYERFFV